MAIAVFTLLVTHASPNPAVNLSNNSSRTCSSWMADLMSSCGSQPVVDESSVICYPRIGSRMSTVALLSDTQIMTIWEWCSDAYLQHGFKIRFPSTTDPKKTYQWRFVKAIAEKFVEWQFDQETAKKFIKIAVGQAKVRGVLKKGLAALHQSNMLKICYDILTNEQNEYSHILKSLESMKMWFDARMGNNPLGKLLERQAGALPNIIIWYQGSQLSDHFITLSKSCHKALMRLQHDQMESRLLPTPTSLYLLKAEFLADANNLKETSRIFGDDWRSI